MIDFQLFIVIFLSYLFVFVMAIVVLGMFFDGDIKIKDVEFLRAKDCLDAEWLLLKRSIRSGNRVFDPEETFLDALLNTEECLYVRKGRGVLVSALKVAEIKDKSHLHTSLCNIRNIREGYITNASVVKLERLQEIYNENAHYFE